MGHVVLVERHALSIAQTIAAVGLPHTTDAGPGTQACPRMNAITLYLGGNDRPRADAAHVSTQHVEKLRSLKETRFAQKLAKKIYSWVSAELLCFPPLMRGA